MKILLLTAHFPSFDCPEKSYATPFLYNYANEWVKMGHVVHVVHYCRKYPFFFNTIARLVKKLGYTGLMKYVVEPEAQSNKDYQYNGVQIHRRQYLKLKPHGEIGRRGVNRLVFATEEILNNTVFIPDVVVGDCISPVVKVLKGVDIFYKCKTYLILHDSDFKLLNNNELLEDVSKIDVLLLRSKKQLKEMESKLGKHKYRYMYSGIPEKEIPKEPIIRRSIHNLIYVGALYKSKGLETILRALALTEKLDYSLKVIGEGIDKEYFLSLVKQLGLEKNVSFLGKKPHDEVFRYMEEADALLLISRETFGMVYIEAMSQGCIPIGAKGEGIDGIVVNKKNGFLTELGDYMGLSDLLDSFEGMNADKISILSLEALNTAKQMTNESLAQEMIDYFSDGII